jgi:hypothetical protein
MTTPCPLCRARYTGHETCQERFERCLAMEFENPAVFGAVHHLTVPSYCLQHNLYSREGWLQSRQLIVLFVEQSLSPQQVRREQRQAFSHPNRAWSVTQGEKLAGVERIIWTRTLADVRLEDPLQYCQDIRTWAASILEDTLSLVDDKSDHG